ncbi:MAG: type VI secretion system-associated protein TagF [Polyangiales bacterium]
MTALVSGFGKVPRMGDFVRVRANAEPTASFEAWIQEAMAYGEAKRRDDWPAIYGNGAIHAFVYRPPKKAKTPSVLAGVFRPSSDAVGRRFPLVVGAPLAEQTVAPGPHLLPLVLGDFFEQATSQLMTVDSVGSLEEFERHVGRVNAPYLEDAGARNAEYDNWAHNTQLSTAWSVLYGFGHSPHPIHAISTLIDCLVPFRGKQALDTPLSARVPLGSGGVAAAAFWIDMVRRIARWSATVPTFFLHFDGYTGSMLIQLGDTPPSSLLELFAPDPSSDHVCDLMGNARFDAEKLLGRLPPAVAQLLQRGDRPVSELLGVLAQ